MSFIQSNDATVYYEEYGSGEPLILIPGLLGTIESHWRRFIPDFARHFHTIAVDLRGHGRTNNPGGALRVHMLVDDLHTLCDTLQIERVRICGYSLGGYVGLAYGIRHPGRVMALIMHGTKFYWTADSVQSTVTQLDPESILVKVPEWGEALARDHAPGNGNEGWRTLLQASRTFIESVPEEGLTEASLGLAGFPILVSVGNADEMIPLQEARRLAQVLPQARLNVMDGIRHSMPSVQKAPFLESALAFFRSASSEHTT